MIASEKLHQNISDYNQFLFKKVLKSIKIRFFSTEKIRNSDNCIYDHAHSFFGEDFNPIRYAGNNYSTTIAHQLNNDIPPLLYENLTNILCYF